MKKTEQTTVDNASQDTTDNIKEFGNTVDGLPEETSDPISIVNIIGEIEGHVMLPPQSKATKYEHIIPQLEQIERSETARGVLLVLNTMGGDVEAGLAIAELVRGLTKPTVSLVLGGGHSIGVPLAVSADHSFIAPTASMMVHPIRVNGLVIGVPQTYSYFRKMQERLTRFVCDNSRISEEKFSELLLNTDELANDIGSVLVGKQAVDVGLIDELGGFGNAVAYLTAKL